MGKSACFTGHRKIEGNPKELFDRLYSVLKRLVTKQGVTDFYAGGAVGLTRSQQNVFFGCATRIMRM